MDNLYIHRRGFILLFLISISVVSWAQDVSDKTIIITKEPQSETSILLKTITNNSGYKVYVKIKNDQGVVKIDGNDGFDLHKGETRHLQVYCNSISVNAENGGTSIWNKAMTKAAWKKITEAQKPIESSPRKDIKKEKGRNKETNKDRNKETQKEEPSEEPQIVLPKIDGKSVIALFRERYKEDGYWSIASIRQDTIRINDYIEELKHWDDKDAYIKSKSPDKYLTEQTVKLADAQERIDNFADDFMASYRDKIIERDYDPCRDSIIFILNERAKIRKDALNKLDTAIREESLKLQSESNDSKSISSIAIIIVGSVLLLVFGVVFVVWRKNKKHPKEMSQSQQAEDVSPSIVVRRKTTSILKKQSLEDVVDSKAYLKIESSEFCLDSAVRWIYIKNTCVKDIYNMYADDLRNPNNPKEDGCMVLGRWVYDEQSRAYDVSLEEIVQPGDDAVFQEYELNFGGKIKLRVAEKLRKLRRDTNLQYDLTCWVHSHPGLGVFFSNSDSNVQQQLQHPAHPNFLTAIVVDILTPQQEFGIFTSKHDSTINSKNDLKKMYSLEELHKWAVESDRGSFKEDDYYDTLSKSEILYEECKGILLNNGSIIDICSIIVEPKVGLAGWVHGFMTMSRDKKEYIVNTISKSDVSVDNEMLGCLVIGTHCSIPSIRKAVGAYSDKMKFVLFYSTSQETLTTIPVDNNQLSMNEKFYSEEKIEDLKIWTRRKR